MTPGCGMNARSDQSDLPRWCALCAANGYHKPENCPERKPDQSESARSDRMSTAMQQAGQTHIVGTLAEAVAVCDTLGIDPRHVIVYGRLMLEERPRVASDEEER